MPHLTGMSHEFEAIFFGALSFIGGLSIMFLFCFLASKLYLTLRAKRRRKKRKEELDSDSEDYEEIDFSAAVRDKHISFVEDV